MAELLKFAEKWRKYLPPNDHGKPSPWCKLHHELLVDEDWVGWSDTEQVAWLKLIMLYARLGHDLPNDIPKILNMLQVWGKKRGHLHRVIKKRIEDGNLNVQQKFNRSSVEVEQRLNRDSIDIESEMSRPEVQHTQLKKAKDPGVIPGKPRKNPTVDLRLKTIDSKKESNKASSDKSDSNQRSDQNKLNPNLQRLLKEATQGLQEAVEEIYA